MTNKDREIKTENKYAEPNSSCGGCSLGQRVFTGGEQRPIMSKCTHEDFKPQWYKDSLIGRCLHFRQAG